MNAILEFPKDIEIKCLRLIPPNQNILTLPKLGLVSDKTDNNQQQNQQQQTQQNNINNQNQQQQEQQKKSQLDPLSQNNIQTPNSINQQNINNTNNNYNTYQPSLTVSNFGNSNLNNNPTHVMTRSVYDTKLPGIPISRDRVRVLKDSAILSVADFEQIKKDSLFSPLKTVATFGTGLSSKDPQSKYDKALLHKQKIIDYDKIIKKKRENYLNQKAYLELKEKQKKIPDDDEFVRTMNKMSLYAKVQTIRDKQMREKKELEKIAKRKEQKLDVMVEIERLKELKRQQDQMEALMKMK